MHAMAPQGRARWSWWRVVVGRVAAVLAVALASGCEAPARVTPWKHAPDPVQITSGTGPGVAARPGTDEDVIASRAHTLRIAIDAEPGRLSPLLSPSVWSRRILTGAVFEPLLRYLPPDRPGGVGR